MDAQKLFQHAESKNLYFQTQYVKENYLNKVGKILKCSLDLIPSPSLSVKMDLADYRGSSFVEVYHVI